MYSHILHFITRFCFCLVCYVLFILCTIYVMSMNILQAHLLHPTLIDLCLQFYSTTAQWMVHLVMADTDGNHLPDKVYIQ